MKNELRNIYYRTLLLWAKWSRWFRIRTPFLKWKLRLGLRDEFAIIYDWRVKPKVDQGFISVSEVYGYYGMNDVVFKVARKW